MIVTGKVVRGLNISNAFIKKYYSVIHTLIGKEFYPYTINLKLSKEDFLKFKLRANLLIKDNLVLHWKKGYLKGFSCICLIPEKTKHKFVVEIICEKKIEIGKRLRVEVK